MGFKPVRSSIQLTSMDADLRTALWNDLYLCICRGVSSDLFQRLIDDVWVLCFKKPLDEKPEYSPSGNIKFIKTTFFDLQWNEVYDFIEFIANRLEARSVTNKFVQACNITLKREVSAYRFVDKTLVPIISDEEVAEIQQALDFSRKYTLHLEQAVSLFADRQAPDYRNSIKESISAVEAICKLITSSAKATLSDALRQLENKLGTLHPALRKAFTNLYGYTSDAEGIRHGMLGESDLDIEDAKFMLITCSAFINYLVAKADKAGLKLTQA